MNLKFYRNKLKIKQSDIASKLGIAQTTYSAYETGVNEPDISTLIKLADFFHVSIDSLVGRNYNNIDFSKFTDTHNNILEKISNMNELQCEKLLSYIDGLNNK